MISAKNKGVFGSVSLATSPEAPLPPVLLKLCLKYRPKPEKNQVDSHAVCS